MYDPRLVDPIRADLTSVGVEELRTASDVDNAIKNSSGTLLVIVNSVCGCAAAAARPGVKLALKHSKVPKKAVTVFAGQDKEATDRARSYFVGFPPSSPSMALLKDGEVVKMIHRHDIEGYSPAEIAEKLTVAFDEYC